MIHTARAHGLQVMFGCYSDTVLANTAAAYPASTRAGYADRAAAVRSGGMAAVADAMLARFISDSGRAQQPALAAAVRAQLLRADAEGYAATCEAIAAVDWQAGLGQIACPVQVISGALDPGSTPAMGQQISDAIPGAQHAVVAAAAHLSVLEQPAAFAAAVDGLLNRL